MIYILILTILIVGLIFYLIGSCSAKNEARVAISSEKKKEGAEPTTPPSEQKGNEMSKMTKEGKFELVHVRSSLFPSRTLRPETPILIKFVDLKFAVYT